MRKGHGIREGRPGILAKILWILGSFISRRLYNRSLNLEFRNMEILRDREPPFLLLANHVTNYDPVVITANQPHMIHWVANDAVFRHPVLRWAFRLAQIIPKTKGMSDLDTVRIMHKKVREGGIVGLFPEGRTCWDGRTLPVMPATAKLIKLLKVPVITVVLRGGYMTRPRWSWKIRRNRFLLDVNVLFEQEEVKKLSVEEIDRRLKEGLRNDDFEFMKKNPVLLESEHRAEHMELFLYICPECGTLDGLRSKGNDVTCRHCGWNFSIDPYGQLPSDDEFPFTDLTEWEQWQYGETVRMASDYLKREGDDTPLLEDRSLDLLTGAGLVPLRKVAVGTLRLWQDRLEYQTERGETLIFPLEELDAPSIFKQQKLEFYHNRVLYRFHYKHPWDSAQKWLSFIEILREAVSAGTAETAGTDV